MEGFQPPWMYYFLFLQEQIKDIIIIWGGFQPPVFHLFSIKPRYRRGGEYGREFEPH
jgi:hypothetical protein